MKIQYLRKEATLRDENTKLLILIHGYGSDEKDLFSFADSLAENYDIVSFRAPKESPYQGYCWYDINFEDSEKFIDVSQAKESLRMILETIVSLQKELGLEDKKVNIIGFSQGAILCYALSLCYPEYFHKIACLSGYPEKKILTHLSSNNTELKKLEFFISHGLQDGVVPIDWAREAAPFLKNLGVTFSFREYLSGHGINQKNFLDLMAFFNTNEKETTRP